MKKTLSLGLILLLGIANLYAGATNVRHGKFQVANNEYAKFAKGNLSYSGSNKAFNLLSSQYEALKSNNEGISSTWYGSWDLFGWGTSKNKGLYPYETSEDASKYASEVGVDVNIINDPNYMEYDWGVHNIITGDAVATFYCPTAAEWDYVLNKRPNAAKLRALATITVGGSPKGLILLPDNWSTPLDLKINTNATDYTDNKFSLKEWTILEACGAIFLPSGGRRSGTTWTNSADGFYWTSTSGSTAQTAKGVTLGTAPEVKDYTRAEGANVRLIENYNYGCTTVKGEETKEDNTIEEYEWNGRILTKSGNYTYTFLEVRPETDSIATLHLRMKDWTGIDNVPTSKKSNVQKVVRDGQLYIIRDDKTYNVAGQEVK